MKNGKASTHDDAALREAQRLAHIGSWSWDAGTDATIGSDELLRIYGLDPATQRIPPFRKQKGRFYSAETWERLNTAVQKSMRTGVGYELDLEAFRNGNPIWITTRGEAVRNAAGQIVGLRGTVQDITERKRGEAALRESENRFRQVADIAPVMIWMSGTDKLCTWFNLPWLEFTGRSMEEERGNGWTAGVHPDDLSRCLDTFVKAFDHRRPFSMQYRLRRHDGEWRWLLDNGIPRFATSGEFAGYIGSCVDISEQKRIETELQESLHRERERSVELAAILEAVPAPVFIAHDPDCLHITGNRAADDLLRNPRGAEASLTASEATKPRHFKAFKDARELRTDELPAQCAARGMEVRDFEFSLVFEDGTTREMLGFGTPLRDEGGPPRGAVNVLVDVTNRKRLERELIEISEHEKRNFGQDLHDGLGQRLTALEIMSSTLALRLKGKAPALANQAGKLKRELRNTLTQVRLMSHSLSPVPLAGDGLMRGLTELANSTSRIPNVNCQFKCNPRVCVQDVITATHLYRIAQEAVNNALKHGRARKIAIRLSDGRAGMVLTIENNGLPMPASHRESSGIGLNTMQYRAEMIGAILSMESSKRKGVRVTCTLRRKSSNFRNA